MVVPEQLLNALQVQDRVGKIRGAMGNAQTPVCQLPNIFFLAQAIWNMRTGAGERESSIRELARLIYPQHSGLLAEAWLSLGSPQAQRAAELADELARRATEGTLGRPGPVGVRLFPDYSQIARDLAAQLRIHAAAVDAIRMARDPNVPDEQLIERVTGYCLLSLEWRRHNGFRNYGTNGYDFFPLREAVHKRWWQTNRLNAKVYGRLEAALKRDYEPWEAELILYPLNH